MSETRSTHRVYAKQWLFDSRHATQEQAGVYAVERYTDRLSPAEVKVEVDDLDGASWVLWTHRWGVVGEFKYATAAHDWSAAIVDDFGFDSQDVVVLERNSRAEHELLQHGVLKVAL